MKIFILVYGIAFLIVLFSVVARIMSRKAIILSTFRMYVLVAITFLIPLIVSGIGVAISGYHLASAFNQTPNIMILIISILCWSIFITAAAVGLYFGSVRLMGEIILVNIEEQKVFDTLGQVLDDNGIIYSEKQAQFYLNDAGGFIRVMTRGKWNFFFLQFTNTKEYFPAIFDGLKNRLGSYKAVQVPWWSLTLFIPVLPVFFSLLNEIPSLKDMLVIDLYSSGEWPRIVGSYGSWGMYLSGQIMGLSLLLLAMRVWIKKPLILNSTRLISWIGMVVLMIHILSLFLVSLTNYNLHIMSLIFCLLFIGFVPYFMRKIQMYYGFMNISPEQVSETLVETLRRHALSFSTTRHVIVLDDGAEFKLLFSNGQMGMEISKQEDHRELINDFLSSLKQKPSTVLVTQNLLILFLGLMITAYWFSPYFLYFLFR